MDMSSKITRITYLNLVIARRQHYEQFYFTRHFSVSLQLNNKLITKPLLDARTNHTFCNRSDYMK